MYSIIIIITYLLAVFNTTNTSNNSIVLEDTKKTYLQS